MRSDPDYDGVPQCGVGSSRGSLLSGFEPRGAGPELEAVVAGSQDVPMVRQAIEKRGGHLGIAEHTGPFAEAEVGGDDDAGLLVEPAKQVE